MSKPAPHKLSDYPHRLIIPTRWHDNDVYGHVNNVIYYAWFDTLVNRFLVDQGVLKVGESDVVGLVVETGCAYFAPIAFPDDVIAGLRVSKLGNSSVRYEIGLFRNDETEASAQGHFVHVYVNEQTRRPVNLPKPMRAVLSEITI